MDFTREPIIETIITPREGHKLVVRSSKNAGQEEYCVDAVEMVSFGVGLFFRSMERPKAFLVPVSDYEVLEVREARVVLKNSSLDRSIKIGGGKEAIQKPLKIKEDKVDIASEEEGVESDDKKPSTETPSEESLEPRLDKKRDRRRNHRKRKGRDSKEEESAIVEEGQSIQQEEKDEEKIELAPVTPTQLSALLQPPPTLISETINRYRQNDEFKGAFYLSEEEQYKPHDKVKELLFDEENEDASLDASVVMEEPIFAHDETVSEAADETLSEVETQEVVDPLENVSEKFKASLSIYADEEDVSMSVEDPRAPESDEQR